MSAVYREEKTPLLIEFTKTQEEGLVQVREIPPISREELEEISGKAVDKAMTIIQDTAKKVSSAIGDDRRPDHVEVEFGIKCDTDYGVMLAKALNEANLNVKLSWDNLAK